MKITNQRRGVLSYVTIVAAIISLTGCSCNPEPAAQPEESPPGEVHIVYFRSLHPELPRGECTGLEWRVEGGFAVELDGRPVEPAGGMDICPQETTTYWLRVDAGDRLLEEQVIVHVFVPEPGEGGEPPPEATEKPPAEGPAPGGNPPPAAPSATLPPTSPPPAAPSNCYTSSTNFITDLAITDIYAGNQPLGQIWVRITNHGPVACSAVSFPFLGCAMVATPKSGGAGVASATAIPITLTIAPGQTQAFATGMGIDTNQWTYMVTCHFAAQSGYNDLNNGNQYYQENIP